MKIAKRFWGLFPVMVILVAGVGFLFKLFRFTSTPGKGEIPGFAAIPLITYLVVGVGFFMLLIWNLLQGNLRDVERPKYRMLEMEEEINRMEGSGIIPREDRT